MTVNYYAPYAKHASNVHDNTDKYCLRNVVTHEFGHFVKLQDVGYGSACDDGYQNYTMWYSTSKGEDKKETLECEDKHGVYQMYHGLTWSD